MLVFGHRGASAYAPENTPEAFRLAAQMGADGVELDVRLASDSRLLVAHDPLPIADRPPPGGFDVPVDLATALDACGHEMLVNVEIKNSVSDGGFDPAMRVVAPVVDELRSRGAASVPRWLISSFSWATIASWRSAAPEIATAWLCHSIDAEGVRRVALAGHTAVHPWEAELTAEVVAMCHDHGLRVNTWTCNDPVRLVELASMGVDGVCTDVPDIARSTLASTRA